MSAIPLTSARAGGMRERLRSRPPLGRASRTGAAIVLGGLLVAVSLLVRVRALGAPLWADEALSVGIAGHPLGDLPSLLRQDGSPPLFYALLHGWIGLVGSGGAATHALSVVFAVLTVPAGLWAGWSLFGVRAGLYAAALLALDPFLTLYAQETRMYALVALLALLATASFLHAFLRGRRRHAVLFAVELALLVLTHDWGVFFGLGALLALVPCALRRRGEVRSLVLDAAIGFGGAVLLYLPWAPTALFQVGHTAAPWITAPRASAIGNGLSALLGGGAPALGLALLGALGVAIAARRPVGDERWALAGLALLIAGLLGSAWLASQQTPAWTPRYLAVALGPLALGLAAAIARVRLAGLAAVAVVLAVWWGAPPLHQITRKSNVEQVAKAAGLALRPGDLVLSTQPEQVPALHYYLPAGLRYVSPLGPVRDPSVVDWRDALKRLRGPGTRAILPRALSSLRPGQRALLVVPDTSQHSWRAPWTRRVKELTASWDAGLRRDRSVTCGPVLAARAPRVSRIAVQAEILVAAARPNGSPCLARLGLDPRGTPRAKRRRARPARA